MSSHRRFLWLVCALAVLGGAEACSTDTELNPQPLPPVNSPEGQRGPEDPTTGSTSSGGGSNGDTQPGAGTSGGTSSSSSGGATPGDAAAPDGGTDSGGDR